MRSALAFVFVFVATACGGNTAATSAPAPTATSVQAPAGSASAKPVGWLEPRIIQSVVRKNFDRFARCYNDALRRNPQLRGRVTTKFVIDRDGTVAMVGDAGSDMPDLNVVKCVVSHFRELRFPEPTGGMVTVVYPIVFRLPDDLDAGAIRDGQYVYQSGPDVHDAGPDGEGPDGRHD